MLSEGWGGGGGGGGGGVTNLCFDILEHFLCVGLFFPLNMN